MTYVTSDVPPFLMIHGEKDHVVPFTQSEFLHQALTEAGADATLIKVTNGDHNFLPNPSNAIIDPSRHEIMRRTIAFFESTLRKA